MDRSRALIHARPRHAQSPEPESVIAMNSIVIAVVVAVIAAFPLVVVFSPNLVSKPEWPYPVEHFTSTSSATALWRTKIGCHHWGPGCWNPLFQGTDSSPAVHYHRGSSRTTVVIGSYDNYLRGLNAHDGSVEWAVYGVGGEDSPKVTTDGVVYAWGGLSSQTLHAIKAGGVPLWTWTVPSQDVGQITSSGIDEDNKLVFAGTTGGFLYGVDMVSGETKWTYYAGGEMWSTRGPLTRSNGIDGRPVVCVGVGGAPNFLEDCRPHVHCVDQKYGTLISKRECGRQIQSQPGFSAASNTMYVGDYGGCLSAFENTKSGKRLWRACMDGEQGHWRGTALISSPVIARIHLPGQNSSEDGARTAQQDLVIVGSTNGMLYSVLGESGKVLWKTVLGPSAGKYRFCSNCGIGSSAAINEKQDTAYVGGPTGLWAINVSTGAPIWFFQTAVQVGSSPAIISDPHGDIIVVGCEDGYLYAVQEGS